MYRASNVTYVEISTIIAIGEKQESFKLRKWLNGKVIPPLSSPQQQHYVQIRVSSRNINHWKHSRHHEFETCGFAGYDFFQQRCDMMDEERISQWIII